MARNESPLAYIFDGYTRSERKIELAKTLDAFVQQIYSGENLTAQQSAKAIAAGVVEIILDDRRANGLLITEDGHFVTAKHCLGGKGNKRNAHIITHTGQEYALDTLITGAGYIEMKHEDLAIGKADMPGLCRIKRYKMYDTDNMKKVPVALLSIQNGRLAAKYGFIAKNSVNTHTRTDSGGVDVYEQQFATTINSQNGDSGSPIVSYDGRLVGIHHGSDKAGMTAAARISKVFDLIHWYRRKLLE